MYDSYPITDEDLETAILAAGGEIVPSDHNGYRLLGRIEQGKRVVFLLQINHAPGSGLLCLELAYQCALRWPCVVWAETWDVLQGDYVVTVYTRNDMERLRVEQTSFFWHRPVPLSWSSIFQVQGLHKTRSGLLDVWPPFVYNGAEVMNTIARYVLVRIGTHYLRAFKRLKS